MLPKILHKKHYTKSCFAHKTQVNATCQLPLVQHILNSH